MQFRDDGPDVPDDLISAQLAGDVVFVVGAGVSARVRLPLFGELVRKVYAHLGQAPPQTPDSLADAAETDAWARSEWDRTLGLLERRLVYPNPNRPEVQNVVREAVAEILRPPQRGSVAHREILDISRDAAGRPRVVTTNFDTLFERALRSAGHDRVASSVGPGLAAVGSPNFHGVMHLHGRIANARLGIAASNLVLTSADFGEAYLRSGWASRFVYDLLRRYTLVFVGYAADDPPMRYMLEATEAGRLHFPDLRGAYAFAPFGETPTSDEGSVRARWRAKGLVPIPYENRDQSHNSLYLSLSAWADCARDPAAWAAGEIARIAGASLAVASDSMRAKVKYLTTTMANTAVLSNCASSSDWIECLIDRNSPPHLLERDANIWFAQRLADRAAVKWALAAQPTIKAIVARATQSHLAVSRVPLSDVMYRFWRLYVTAFGRENESDGLDRLALRAGPRASSRDYFTIESVVEIVRPRLRLAAPWSFPGSDDESPVASEPSLRDLAYSSFECREWPPWREILAGWPQDAETEYRLLSALGRTLATACELAREACLIDASGDQTSREVQLVHELEPAEAAVPSLSEGHHGGDRQRVDTDEHRRSFVPIVRLMSGLWRRLAGHDARRARAIARSWIEQDFLLFQRLGYWAAAVSDDGPIGVAAEMLCELSLASFWLEHHSAEAARFWCRRWNSLPRKTRLTIESHILAGPPKAKVDWPWPEVKSDRRRRANFMRYRELTRITTAGGDLSHRARAMLARLTERLENPPPQISVVEGLQLEMWSGPGRQGDTSLVAEVSRDGLLERIAEIEAADPLNQDGLWLAICRERPADAVGALVLEGDRGIWPPERWREYLNSSPMAFKDGINEDEVASVLRALCDMPADILDAILPPASVWLKSLAVTNAGKLRDPILVTWDRLLAALPRWADAHDRAASSNQRLFEESVDHPAGTLAAILITLQDRSPKEPAGGLAPDLRPRFEQLTELGGRLQKLALAPLVQLLPFFLWLAPDWAEEKLCKELDRDDGDARQLLATLILFANCNDVRTFNRLKPILCAALIDAQTEEDVRNRIAQLVTWAIGWNMRGNTDFNLTEPEARRLLTLSPPTGLRSVAWGLWRTLAAAQTHEKRDVWSQHLKPLLECVWPNDVVARGRLVSDMLIKIPAAAGELLPEVVDLMLRLIVPGKVNSVEFDFDLHDKPKLIREFSHEIFDLVSASIELKERPPYDLAKFLDEVVVVAPDLRDDARYVALRNRLQRF